jgi:hypothetical protein
MDPQAIIKDLTEDLHAFQKARAALWEELLKKPSAATLEAWGRVDEKVGYLERILQLEARNRQ